MPGAEECDVGTQGSRYGTILHLKNASSNTVPIITVVKLVVSPSYHYFNQIKHYEQTKLDD